MNKIRHRDPIILDNYEKLVRPRLTEALKLAAKASQDDPEFIRYVLMMFTQLVNILAKADLNMEGKKPSEVFEFYANHMKGQYEIQDRRQTKIDSMKVGA